MIYSAQDFSDFERCARIPGLKKKYDPIHWPVREAVKRFFLDNLLRDPEETAEQFLYEAANRGYAYPVEDHYELAKDYAAWIEGALRILQEDFSPESIPLLSLGNDSFAISGYVQDSEINVVRVVHAIDSRVLRWPELIAMALGDYETVNVHQYRLPQIVKGRLSSPLVLAHQHPMTGGYRLAKLEGEPIKFGPNWKRIARWEMEDVDWAEWRLGIDRDKCLPLIRESYSVHLPNYQDKSRIKNDIEHIIASMSRSTHPRKWEACENCIFYGYCHGNKQGYSRKGMQRSTVQREEEALNLLS